MIKFKRPLQVILIFVLGIALGYVLFTKSGKVNLAKEEKNTPRAFISEIYDKIKENYWDNLSDAQLLDLFKQSFEKNGQTAIAGGKFADKEKMLRAIYDATKGMDETQRNKFTSNISGTVLASLNPPGRSGLYTQKLETQLKNSVENVNPEKDLYKDLGLGKGASKQEVEKSYQELEEKLKQENTPQSREKLKQIAYAKDVLTADDKKIRYDQKGVEPTIFTKVINGNILYLQFKKFSPTSYDEFIKAFESYKDNSKLDGLVLDLRGNIGGAIDATAYFLGLFLGKNAYAYEFYHKGEYQPFKTPSDKLLSVVRYKQVVLLVDDQTQSSAEIMAAAFKKYHLGVVVGVPTKGWGTVEKVFQLDNQIDPGEKYSMFLVHSITLRDDNQPIEGRGVEPDVNIKNVAWERQLFPYFRNDQLIQALKTVL